MIICNKEYRSKRFLQSDWTLIANILTNKETIGTVTVAYTERRPDCFKGPYLEEEVFLLEAIASLIGQSLERKTLEEEKTRLYIELQNNYEKSAKESFCFCATGAMGYAYQFNRGKSKHRKKVHANRSAGVKLGSESLLDLFFTDLTRSNFSPVLANHPSE